MAGSCFTYTGNSSPSSADAAFQTSQGVVLLGQSGLFLPSEVQAAAANGIILVPGPAVSPASLLTSLAVAAGSAGNPNGAYHYAVTFVTAAGETKIGPETSFTLSSAQGSLSNIPLGTTQSGVTGRKIYRTAAGGGAGTERLVTTISDNSTTTFTDNVADGSLGASAPTSDTSAVFGGSSPAPQRQYALLTGNPADDADAIGAGTGGKISVGGSLTTGVTVGGSTPSALLVTDSSGDMQSGPPVQSVENASSREFDIRDFGIPAGTLDTTDRSAAWASMIATVNGLGGGLIEVPAGQYCILDVYLLSNVWLRFLPGVTFIFPQTGFTGGDAIFRLETTNFTLTSYITNVKLFGRFVVDCTTFPGNQYNNTNSPRGIQLGNVQDFYIEDAHGIAIPGPAGNTIQGNALGGGARIVPNDGYIGRVTHVNSPWMGNSAIQLGGSRDLVVGYAWIDFGTAFRVEAHVSGPSNTVDGYCESVTCISAASDANSTWQPVTGVAATGVFTCNANGLAAGTPVQLREKTGGTSGISVDTTYYVVNPTTNTFQLSATVGGSAITWTTDISAAFVGTVSRAVVIIAHDTTLIRRVKVLQARARGGADGVYVSHDSGATIEDCEVSGIDVEGGGKSVMSEDGSQFDMSGFTFGPGTVRSAAGAGCHLLPFATYRDMRAKSCSGVGFRDLQLPSGSNVQVRIIGGGAEKNGSFGYQQSSFATFDLVDVVTKDPPPGVGSNLLTADEADYETGTGTTYTAVGTASVAQDATVFHTGTHSLKVTVGSGGAGTVRTALAPSAKSVTAGQSVFCSGYCYAVAAARQARFNVRFFDNTNTQIGADLSTLNVALTVGSWVFISGYVTAPANAVQMTFFPLIATANASEVFNWDTMTMAIASGSTPTQFYGITVGSGLRANLIAGDHSQNGTAPSTGAGSVLVTPSNVEQVNTVPASGSGTVTLPDVTVDTINVVTLTGNPTLAFPTAAAGKSFLLALVQDGTGTRTVTWPGTAKWAGGTAPTLTTTAAKTDVFSFVCIDGTNWIGTVAGENF